MAIMRTCKVAVYVVSRGINSVISYIQKEEIMEMAEGGKSLPESAIKGVERELLRIEKAIAAARRVQDGRVTFKRRKPGKITAMDEKHMDAARSCADEILRISGQMEKNHAKVKNIEESLQKYEQFADFDGEEFFGETESVKYGVFGVKTENKSRFEEEMSGVPFCFEIIESAKDQEFLFCVYLKRDSEAVEKALKSCDFSPPDFELNGLAPCEEIKRLKAVKKELSAENERLYKELQRLSKSRSQMELLYDVMMLKKQRYSAFLSAGNTEKVFVLTGYVLKKRFSEFKKGIERLGGAVEEIPADEEEILPVAFENNAFSAPVEEVTASYSMPDEKDIDPNPVMAIFYYWFFGMMFSDAGYGILMMIGCGILGFSRILSAKKQGIYRMFFWCGVSTTLWGVAYGSFFGDLIGTVSAVFGRGNTEFLPIIIDPVNQALELLIISVVFGVIHILAALFMKFFVLWRDGKKADAVCDAGSWILVLLGGGLFSAGVFFETQLLKFLGLILAGIGVLVLLFLGGREKKSPFMRVFAGILKLYDITGLVGDILSYSRLMALGLATGVIASVVNVLASLGGNSVWGTVVFVVVAIFGHTVNFAINMLGAYVHTNRLQYVEFYQKFYSGGGRRFRPVSMETRYFDFTDN